MRPLSDAQRKSLETAVSRYETSIGLARPYLLDRGISLDTARKFRLGLVAEPLSGHEQFEGRLAIPALGPRGPYSLRFRCMEKHDCKEANCPKYLGQSGDQTRLFNIRAIQEAGDEICVTEGELDAVILSQLGLPAVGVCGAGNWKKHHPRMFGGFVTVWVWGDGDKAGTSFARKITETLETAVAVQLPRDRDVNELFLERGTEGILELMNR